MIQHTLQFTIPAAYSFLPPEMKSDRATAMLLAIGLQESKFQHRRQDNYGPARSFWQFEKGGVRGVMRHPKSRDYALNTLRAMRYPTLLDKPSEVHYAIHDNDVLACVLARLLLWTVPGSLPRLDNPQGGWAQYVEGWRPGKPRPADWPDNFDNAWALVLKEAI